MVPIELQIDPSFFMEEDQNGFHVSKQRKEIWAVELDLLSKFNDVCQRHDLKYCVGAGTLLGAVRHQGFIPWDDDIDIYMLRPDYDKLLSFSDEFVYPYFIQNSYTEKNLLKTFTRIRNSTTTGFTKSEEGNQINKGIFIDIFPLDGISENRFFDFIQRCHNHFYKKIFRWFNTERSNKIVSKDLKGFLRKIIFGTLVRDKIKFFKKYEKNIKKYSNQNATMWGNRTIWSACPKSRRPIDDWLNLTTKPFEFLQVPVPQNYDEILKQQYGDYMKIPDVKGVNQHGELTFSTDISYSEYKRTSEQ